jgi:hypothetical protein
VLQRGQEADHALLFGCLDVVRVPDLHHLGLLPEVREHQPHFLQHVFKGHQGEVRRMDQTAVKVGRGDGGPAAMLHRLVAPPVVVGAQIGGELFHIFRQDHRVDMHIDHDEGLHHTLKALLLCVVQGDR